MQSENRHRLCVVLITDEPIDEIAIFHMVKTTQKAADKCYLWFAYTNQS